MANTESVAGVGQESTISINISDTDTANYTNIGSSTDLSIIKNGEEIDTTTKSAIIDGVLRPRQAHKKAQSGWEFSGSFIAFSSDRDLLKRFEDAVDKGYVDLEIKIAEGRTYTGLWTINSFDTKTELKGVVMYEVSGKSHLNLTVTDTAAT